MPRTEASLQNKMGVMRVAEVLDPLFKHQMTVLVYHECVLARGDRCVILSQPFKAGGFETTVQMGRQKLIQLPQLTSDL